MASRVNVNVISLASFLLSNQRLFSSLVLVNDNASLSTQTNIMVHGAIYRR